jgi:lipopolysaccharide biosynthesis glycosyltransferase
MSKRNPIFFTFDEGYVAPAAVTFESLLSNARAGVFYELFVLHTGISLESQRRLAALVERHANAQLSFISVAGMLESAGITFDNRNFCLGHKKGKFTKDTLLRCLPTIVPEFDQYEQILYSDVDVCVVDDISEIFETNLGNYYLAGCRIPAFLSQQVAHFPESLRSCYCAGGIWLMNLRRLREDDIGKKVIQIMSNPPFRLLWNDQDVMNLACSGNVTFLSYRYCSIPLWRTMLASVRYADIHYPEGELRDALFRPKIVHYAYAKPWNGPCEDDALWHYWYYKTGLKGEYEVPSLGPVAMVYLLKFLPVPSFLVHTYFREGELVIKIFGFLLRVRLRRMSVI